MRGVFVVVWLAGCNAVFGLDKTKPVTSDGGVDLCDPLPFDTHRYMADSSGAGGFTWAAARADCQRYGFDLAVIDANDSAEITNELQTGVAPFWLGVSYDGTQWSAIDQCTPLLAWASGEPDPSALGQCVAKLDGGMIATDCTSSTAGPDLNALCETPRPNAQCRAYAAQRDYVALDPAMQVSEISAEQLCAAMGRHVVEIDSTDELDYLRQTYAQSPRFWLGATTNFQTWSSPTGCPQVFVWAGGEPDNVNPCSYQDVTGMHAAPCNMPAVTLAPVICEANQ